MISNPIHQLESEEDAIAFAVAHTLMRAFIHGRLQSLGLDYKAQIITAKVIASIEQAEGTPIAEIDPPARDRYITAISDFLSTRIHRRTNAFVSDPIESIRSISPP